jgi:hypothetical protein
MMRQHSHKIQFPIFSGYQIRVTFTSDIEAAVTKEMGGDWPSDSAAYTVQGPHGSHIILSHTATAEDIAHEAFHAIWALMKWTGAELEEEVVAYHLGHVVGRIVKWSKRHAQNA